jgi:rhodanese-related sulfurtransferase
MMMNKGGFFKAVFFSAIMLLGFVSISCNGGTSQETSQTSNKAYTNVSVNDLNTVVQANEDVIVLDVRTPSEVSEGYVNNALNLDVNGSTFKQQAQELDKTKTVYVYCRSGHRSQIASKTLMDMGFTDVRNVEGGFMAWIQNGYQIIK